MTVVFILAAIVAFGQSLYVGRPLLGFLAATGIVLLAWVATGVGSWTAFAVVAAIPLTVAALFGLPLLRRPLLSKRLMAALSGLLPRMGETERIALEAGTVWWDGELFSGDPDWQQLLAFQPRGLSEAEQAFLDGPVEELCRMLDDWQIWQDRAIPDEIWDYLKKERFFGMIIPREHGGLGFSAIAHSAVVAKVTSRSVPTVCALMVPNSLGPAELLLLYGTEAQRQHYLPRLATGEEIPCFALTEPHAGSDAAAPRSRGVVCRGRYDGEEVVGIRLDWDKRYITLAPVATLIGLAFHLSDPEGLLGGAAEPGITCALVPHHLPGIDIGAHHDPLGVPFPNGPIKGKGVFIPIDFVIGGREGVGNGWRMLMNCLAAGRSISLPSLSVGAAQLATRTVGAYGTVREQFGLPIGRFEGIEEALARIAGHTYLMNAARVITCGAVDAGEKPAVISGIVKAYLTQAMRDVLSDAMDIQAGAGICRGPNNILGRGFSSVPLGITVEGANILTRSMIVYGQGAIRCHPYLSAEMRAIEEKDLAAFDRAFFGHLTFAARNVVRALVLGLTGARWVTHLQSLDPTERRLRPGRRCLHGDTGRRPEAAGEDQRAHGRCLGLDVSGFLRPQAFSRRGPPRQRSAGGGVGLRVGPLAGRTGAARGVREPAGRCSPAPVAGLGLSLRTLRRPAARQPGRKCGAGPARGRGAARASDPRHLRAGGRGLGSGAAGDGARGRRRSRGGRRQGARRPAGRYLDPRTCRDPCRAGTGGGGHR
jgi:acyl-CoA dehydrogenase